MSGNEQQLFNSSTSHAGPEVGDTDRVSTSTVPAGPTMAIPVAQLVAQYLVGRVDDLPAPQVAAFVSGWSNALDLVRRTDLTLPDAPDNVRQAIAALCGAIEQAQRAVLADPED